MGHDVVAVVGAADVVVHDPVEPQFGGFDRGQLVLPLVQATQLPAGGTLAIVGESGSGKSTTAMAAIGLLPGNGRVTAGSVRFAGEELVGLPESRMRRIRGRRIGLVPQDPMSNLNPVTRVGQQIGETLLTHGMATKKDVGAAVVEVMERAGIPEPARRAKQYPHELSGGLRQRVLIAIGLACRPQLLIADEPTSALDVTVQQVILDQIGEMTRELGSSVLLITHDLGLAAERAQQLVVMHRGRVVESGDARAILEDPQHAYTRSLVAAAPSVAAARLLPEAFDPAPVALAEDDTAALTTVALAKQDLTPLVEIRYLTKVYPVRGHEDFTAAKDVSLKIPRGKTVSIVGESGSGKTTTARMLLKLIEPTSGEISFEGKDVLALKGGRGSRTSGSACRPCSRTPSPRSTPRSRWAGSSRSRCRRTGGATPGSGGRACSSSWTRWPCPPTSTAGTRPSSRVDSASAWRSPARSR